MEKVLENTTIIQKSGVKQHFDAIVITENGIYTGGLKNVNNQQKFEDYHFIPRDQIKNILVFNDQGKLEDIDF